LKVHGINPVLTFINPDSICWISSSENVSDKALTELSSRLKDEYKMENISIKKDMAVVGLVGQGLKKKPQAIATSINALDKANIEIDSIDFGTSELCLYILVDQKNSKDAVQAIFDANFRK